MSDTSDAQPQPANIVQVDYLDVPEFHADGLSGISVRNGVAKLNFFSVRHTKVGVDEPRGAVTVTISLTDLVAMVGGLNGAVSQLQSQGLFTFAPQQPPQTGRRTPGRAAPRASRASRPGQQRLALGSIVAPFPG